ncbi:MAG: pyridoxal-phosphate dependent enzyme, partial [Halobacteriaceae archaeon]
MDFIGVSQKWEVMLDGIVILWRSGWLDPRSRRKLATNAIALHEQLASVPLLGDSVRTIVSADQVPEVMVARALQCLNCGETHEIGPLFEGCPTCRTDDFRSNVVPVYDLDSIELSRSDFESRDDGVWSYPELLPVASENSVSLGEGATPLIDAPEVAETLGISNLYVKDESQNPTWSYKDRLNSVAISKGLERGVNTVTVSSTGNHGASTAAYAARAGMDAIVFTTPGGPETMLAQMSSYGANIVATPEPEDRWKAMQRCIENF